LEKEKKGKPITRDPLYVRDITRDYIEDIRDKALG